MIDLLNEERQRLIIKSFMGGLSDIEQVRLDDITEIFNVESYEEMKPDLERMERNVLVHEELAADINQLVDDLSASEPAPLTEKEQSRVHSVFRSLHELYPNLYECEEAKDE